MDTESPAVSQQRARSLRVQGTGRGREGSRVSQGSARGTERGDRHPAGGWVLGGPAFTSPHPAWLFIAASSERSFTPVSGPDAPGKAK